MATVKVTTKIIVTDTQGDTIAREYSATASSLTAITQREIAVGASSTVAVWDASAQSPTDFDALVLASDVALDVEMTINEGNANEELNSFRLAASTPIVLFADDAYFNHSASDAFAGTLNVIDKIRVKGTGTAGTVYLLLGT